MTPQTVGVGIGLLLAGLGVLVIALARSAWSERRAARATQDVIDTARARAAFRRLKALPETDVFDPKPDLPRTRLVSVPLNVVPLQRDRLSAEADDAFYTAPRDGSGEF